MTFTMTKIAAAAVLATVAMSAQAAPVAWTGGFSMFDPTGLQMNANDGVPLLGVDEAGDPIFGPDTNGLVAAVTGAIDVAAGTFTLASTDTFFGQNWATSGGTLFGAGTHTVSTIDPGCSPAVACGGDYTFTVGAGQLGGMVDFEWGGATGIDVLMVWNVTNDGSVISYSMTDPDGNNIPGTGMIDGPFNAFNANFNMAAPVPEASTYGMMLAGLGLVGFAVRRRKLMA